jgi:hypothetical protein
MCKKSFLVAMTAVFGWCGIAFAGSEVSQEQQVEPAKASAVQPSPAASSVQSSLLDDFVLRSVSAKTLTTMRMHPATNPDEAALRCHFMEPCVMGLTRGFGVGGDFLGMLSSLVYQPQARAGAWLLVDAFVNYQFVDAVEKIFHANGSIGYRSLSYEDSNENTFRTGGLSWRFNYAQDITSEYTQGLTFSGLLSSWHSVKPQSRFLQTSTLDSHSENSRRAMRDFYEYSHAYPTLWLSFPADLEVINWKASYIDLPSDLRGYAHVEPFFAQNEFKLPNEAFSWVERNFGLRTAATLAYESRPDRVAGRYTLQASAGLEFATSSPDEQAPTAADVSFDLPEREPVSPYLDLGLTWQF